MVSGPWLGPIPCTSGRKPATAKLGVLFDIDELGGGLYGYLAYKIFFAAVDTRQLAGCLLSDGDTNATLSGNTRHYCIAVQSYGDDVSIVRNALGACSAKGLLPLSSRFLPDYAVEGEPLVLAGRIDAVGRLVDCKTGWVKEAWEKSRERHAASSPTAGVARPLPADGTRFWTDEMQAKVLSTKVPSKDSAGRAQSSKRSMPKRERSIGIIFLIASFALFEVGVQSIVATKQPPTAAMVALQISTLLGFLGSGYVAAKRGRSKAWALLGFISWIGIIVAFLLPNRSAHGDVKESPDAVALAPNATASQGIATLFKLCLEQRYRLGILDDEPLFHQAVEELRRDGVAGTQAIAALMDRLLAARCEEIQDVLTVASRLSPQPELVSAIQRVISAPPVIAGSLTTGPFTPIIFGEGKIGWDNPSAARIKKQASAVLRMLGVDAEATGVKPAIAPLAKDVSAAKVASTTPTVSPAPAPLQLPLPPIGPGFLASTFTPAEEPAGKGVGAFWEGIQCSTRDENDRAEAAFKEAILKGVPPTCESYAKCELGKLALAKGQLKQGVGYLLRSLGAEKKSQGVALDAAMRLHVIYAAAGRADEANKLAKLAASANARGLALTGKAEQALRQLVHARRTEPDPVERQAPEVGAGSRT